MFYVVEKPIKKGQVIAFDHDKKKIIIIKDNDQMLSALKSGFIPVNAGQDYSDFDCIHVDEVEYREKKIKTTADSLKQLRKAHRKAKGKAKERLGKALAERVKYLT